MIRLIFHTTFLFSSGCCFIFVFSDLLDDICGPFIGLGGCVAPVVRGQNGKGNFHMGDNDLIQPGCFPKAVPEASNPPPFFDPTSTIQEMTSGCVGVGNHATSKTKKIMYDLLDNDEFDREEIPTYEEVARLFPRPGLFRPIVLIGAPGVGRNELKRRLMALESDRYKATIPRMCRNSFIGL